MLRTQEEILARTKKRARDLEQQLSLASEFFKDSKVVGKGVWSVRDVPGQPYTLLEVLVEARRVVKAVSSLTRGRAALAPTAACSGLEGSLNALGQPIDRMAEVTAQLRDDHRPMRLTADFRIITTISEEEIANIAEISASLAQAIEPAKAALAPVAIFGKYDQQADEREMALISAQIALLNERDGAAVALVARISALKSDAETLLEKLGEAESQFNASKMDNEGKLETIIASAEGAQAKAEGASNSASEACEVADEKRIEVKKILEESQSLHGELKVFAGEFDDVARELGKERDGIKSMNEAAAAQQTRIDEMIRRADSMVSGATVAGLAKAFADERASLDTSMRWAMLSFFSGILILFLVTGLLAAYVFEIPIYILGISLSGAGKTTAVGDEINIAGVLSRTIILIAPFWMTLFSARRYRNLFDLRQQYSHKYNMAFSVDGFKQQAPRFEEEMAAWVFHIVAEGPITNRSKLGGMDENPLPKLEDIVRLPVEQFKKLLGERQGGS